MPKYVAIDDFYDKVVDTQKVTAGFFEGGIGTLTGGSEAAANLVTASLSATQKNYYYNLQYSSKDHMSVAYGHIGGSGSSNNKTSTTNGPFIGETEAIYKHFADLLLDPVNRHEGDSIEEGFQFVSGNLSHDVFVLSFERAKMKDRINRKNWTLGLSGSTSNYSHSVFKFTDDSEYNTATITGVGPRYNIVSGSGGTRKATGTFGYFYPNVGIMVLNASEGANSLSSSIPGNAFGAQTSSALTGQPKGSGLNPDLNSDNTADNALKLVKAIQMAPQTFRNEEDQNTVSYFCRARAPEFNSSNNPTFTSGSDHKHVNPKFYGNPQTFVTTVGLFNDVAGGGIAPQLMAVGKLSAPVKKNNSTEVTLKVNLTF